MKEKWKRDKRKRRLEEGEGRKKRKDRGNKESDNG